MSDSLRLHELQHARPPCPSPTPGVHPNSCPLIESSEAYFFEKRKIEKEGRKERKWCGIQCVRKKWLQHSPSGWHRAEGPCLGSHLTILGHGWGTSRNPVWKQSLYVPKRNSYIKDPITHILIAGPRDVTLICRNTIIEYIVVDNQFKTTWNLWENFKIKGF